MTQFTILHSVSRYIGKVRTLRNEIRTERLLNSLPAEVRKDIGWPHLHYGWQRHK